MVTQRCSLSALFHNGAVAAHCCWGHKAGGAAEDDQAVFLCQGIVPMCGSLGPRSVRDVWEPHQDPIDPTLGMGLGTVFIRAYFLLRDALC